MATAVTKHNVYDWETDSYRSTAYSESVYTNTDLGRQLDRCIQRVRSAEDNL
jgi:Ca2+-binding RTX toxin-like protein